MEDFPICYDGELMVVIYTAYGILPKKIVVKPRDDNGPVYYVPERTARMEVCHGHHGSEPHYPEDRWTQYYVCCACQRPVSPGDAWCRHCGARFGEVAGDDE